MFLPDIIFHLLEYQLLLEGLLPLIPTPMALIGNNNDHMIPSFFGTEIPVQWLCICMSAGL
jgi:hypothetical protein